MAAPPFDAATLTTLEVVCGRAVAAARLNRRLDVHELMNLCVDRLRALVARGRPEDRPPWTPDFLRSVARRRAQEWLRGEQRCRSLKFPEQVAARSGREPLCSIEHLVDVLTTAPRPATALEVQVLELRLNGRSWGVIALAQGLKSRSRPGKLYKSVLGRFQKAWERFGDLKPALQPPRRDWVRHSPRLQEVLCDVHAGELRRTICERHHMTRGALRTLICLHGGEAKIRAADACGDTCAISTGAAQSCPIPEVAVVLHGPSGGDRRPVRPAGGSAMARTVVPLLPKGVRALAGACFCGPWVDLPEIPHGWSLVVGFHGGPTHGSARLRLQTADAAGVALDIGDEVALHDPRHVVQALPEGLGPRVRVAIDPSAALDTRILAYLEAPSP